MHADDSCSVENLPSLQKHNHVPHQSYKQFTLVIYDSRVVPDLKIPHITTLES